MVDVAPGRAATHPGDLVLRIDPDVVDRSQVDHQAVVHGTESGHAVAPASYRQVEAVLAAGRDCCHYVSRVRALNHRNRSPVVHPVVNGASLVVVGICRGYDASTDGLCKGLDHVAHALILLAAPPESSVPRRPLPMPQNAESPGAMSTLFAWCRRQDSNLYSLAGRGF